MKVAMLLEQLITPPWHMAGGCACTVWQSVMVLAHSPSFLCVIFCLFKFIIQNDPIL